MKKYALIPLSASCLMLSSCQTTDMAQVAQVLLSNPQFAGAATSALSNQDITAAFKQALTIGTSDVVGQLGVRNGFNLDPKVHIPLPANLQKVQSVLNTVGLSHLMDDLESRMNYAAEIATPHAKELFVDAISSMSFDDVLQIYNGPQDSATRFFESRMSSALASRMQPFVDQAVSQAGVVQAFDNVMSQYQNIPFVPDVKSDLTSYVVDQGIQGIFFYLGQQEAQIRQDPVRHTTDLLKKVFGSQG